MRSIFASKRINSQTIYNTHSSPSAQLKLQYFLNTASSNTASLSTSPLLYFCPELHFKLPTALRAELLMSKVSDFMLFSAAALAAAAEAAV